MKALEYRFNLPKYLLTRTAGKRGEPLTYGPLSSLRLREVADPVPPSAEWHILRPILAGICGTDTALLSGKASPMLEPWSSFPAVLGHEIVARIERLAVVPQNSGAPELGEGERVVVDPFLHCVVRGLDPCPNCQAGLTSACRNATQGRLAPALIMGTCRDLPGGWSERMVAHPSQLFRVPDEIIDDVAVLVEPLSVAVHAVLRSPPAHGESLLIIGGGTIGLCVLAALRLLNFDVHVTLLARHGFQRELALRFGADEVVSSDRDAALRLAVTHRGARMHKPTLGRAVPDWGFDWVCDCVGTPASLDDGLRTARPGGTFVLLGCAREAPHLDWTLVWSRELNVRGSCGYGVERFEGRRLHTFQLVMELMRRHPEYPLRAMLTHRYPLTAYREALRAAFRRSESGAIKVVFAP